MKKGKDIEIVEVGPRDGLQNLASPMPTNAKKQWLSGAAAAGLAEIEVCSFVPASRFPQFADSKALVAYACQLPHLTVSALVPNARGATDALARRMISTRFAVMNSWSAGCASHRLIVRSQARREDQRPATRGRYPRQCRSTRTPRAPRAQRGG